MPDVTVTLSKEDWDLIVSAADCGLASLDPGPQKAAWGATERLEAAVAKNQNEGSA